MKLHRDYVHRGAEPDQDRRYSVISTTEEKDQNRPTPEQVRERLFATDTNGTPNATTIREK